MMVSVDEVNKQLKKDGFVKVPRKRIWTKGNVTIDGSDNFCLRIYINHKYMPQLSKVIWSPGSWNSWVDFKNDTLELFR